MAKETFDDVFDFDDEFDPLEVDDNIIDQEDMDDDNPLDTVDYPTMRNMPEELSRPAVYTPERMGSTAAALEAMLDRNPARRGVLLSIIDWCRGEEGCLSSIISERVDELQVNNRSVYSGMTLCRMLERTGALVIEMPEVADEKEDAESGVEYMVINEKVDPVWRATDEALEVYEAQTHGSEFRRLVLDIDRKYLEVYRAVMELVDEKPRTRFEIEELSDSFEVVYTPRRFGTHFIDILERVDALEWRDHRWQLTDLGRTMLSELNENETKGE